MRPAPASLFFIGMIGFVICAYFTATEVLDPSWGTAFCLTFIIMFISGVASMTPEDDLEYKLTLDDEEPSAQPDIEETKKTAKTKKKKK